MSALLYTTYTIRRIDLFERIFNSLIRIESNFIDETVQSLLVEDCLHSTED